MVQVNPGMPQAVQNRASAGERTRDINVGETERMASVIGGGMLALGGLAFCPNTVGKIVSAALGGALVYRGLSGHCHLFDALAVSTAEKHGEQAAVEAGAGVKVEHVLTINRPAVELYRFWRQLDNLPQFMRHLKEVRVLDSKHSHWVARGPLGTGVEWDAEIDNEKPDSLITWRSLPGSEVDTAGSVHFEAIPGGRSTRMRVVLKYDPPTGKAGALIARFFGSAPEQQVRDDLQRFKEIMEGSEPAGHRRVGMIE